MAKNKGARILMTLECTSCRITDKESKRKSGVFRYASKKNRKNTPARMELKKFCPNCNSHVIFKEIK
uniref:ribosomal protein L33 n=1 Tax=Timspurckia oligopyrenoides TaxID=708627 RepID=UPI001FCCE151|nr:ribosomal protein L33 [Timspurckia oligopyrenoides]UNJ17599.1 ribosomal protein L33 [Timspurckia oligopyrenoides]